MEAGRRRVSSGKEFDHLFPAPTGNDTTIKKDADVGNTVKFIQEQVPKTLDQTKKIAEYLKGKTDEESLENVWNFTYKHIPYKRDEDGVEQVRSPRRTWHDRNKVGPDGKVGVDCDCYSVFVSSILMNLNIPHKYRITKYPKTKKNETPRWQHIYVVVPKERKLNKELEGVEDYITVDCVKDAFDDEQPYLEKKDYNANMRLDYLDGIDGDEEFEVPNTMDAKDMASIYDEDDLGKVGQWVKKAAKKVGKAASKAVHVVNKVTNPGTILLRNGFLEAMKLNLFNVAGRLRFAYLTDEQAKKLNVDLGQLAKVRKIKDKAEGIYYTAGGEKVNLKKAILKGKGNHDKKVPLNGLYGLGEIYADQEEYDTLHGLGVLTTSAIAAATTVIATIAKTLDQVKGLVKSKPGSPAQSSDSSSSDSSATTQSAVSTDSSTDSTSVIQASSQSDSSQSYQMTPQASQNASSQGQDMPESFLPATTSNARIAASDDNSTAPAASTTPAPSNALSVQDDKSNSPASSDKASAETIGIFAKTGGWIKEHPGVSALIAAGLVTGGYFILKKKKGNKKSGNSSGGQPVSGLPVKKRKRKAKSTKSKKTKIKAVRIR